MVLNNMHGIYSRKGDYRKSLDTLLETERIDLQTGDQLSLAIAWYNIAATCMAMQDSDRAREYYGRYLELSARISNHLGEGYGNYGLGSLCSSEGDWEKAVHHYGKAAEVFDRLGSRGMADAARLHLAGVMVDHGRTEEASGLLRELGERDTEGDYASYILYLSGLIRLAESNGDREMMEQAASDICQSLSDADGLSREDVAVRNVKLAGILRSLDRDGECRETLCKGAEILGGMMAGIDPGFIDDVIRYEGLSEFLTMCEEAGCPVRLPAAD
jgi:tetratricopeptide (TPR) repeat protein